MGKWLHSLIKESIRICSANWYYEIAIKAGTEAIHFKHE